MKNVIITGGTGFFGINLVEELLEKGYYLTVTVRQGSEHNKRLPDSDRLIVLENDPHTVPDNDSDNVLDKTKNYLANDEK